jgi:hypothetical protein
MPRQNASPVEMVLSHNTPDPHDAKAKCLPSIVV